MRGRSVVCGEMKARKGGVGGESERERERVRTVVEGNGRCTQIKRRGGVVQSTGLHQENAPSAHRVAHDAAGTNVQLMRRGCQRVTTINTIATMPVETQQHTLDKQRGRTQLQQIGMPACAYSWLVMAGKRGVGGEGGGGCFV